MSHFAEIALLLPPLPVERTQTSRDLWAMQQRAMRVACGFGGEELEGQELIRDSEETGV